MDARTVAEVVATATSVIIQALRPVPLLGGAARNFSANSLAVG
jgi:hypothetical protein